MPVIGLVRSHAPRPCRRPPCPLLEDRYDRPSSPVVPGLLVPRLSRRRCRRANRLLILKRSCICSVVRWALPDKFLSARDFNRLTQCTVQIVADNPSLATSRATGIEFPQPDPRTVGVRGSGSSRLFSQFRPQTWRSVVPTSPAPVRCTDIGVERQPSGQRQSLFPTANKIDPPPKKGHVKSGAYSLRPPFLLRQAACQSCR